MWPSQKVVKQKVVRVLVTDDDTAVLVYDGEVLIARLDMNEGKPYKT